MPKAGHNREMIVLGISFSSRDSAAALLCDGEIVVASQEERFTRRKHEGGFPWRSIAYCLAQAGIKAENVDVAALCGEPSDRVREALGAIDPRVDWSSKPMVFESHQAQVASAFFPSPFRQAAVLALDGGGGRVATSFAIGRDNALDMLQEIDSPDSLGLLYSAFTHLIGFKAHSGEYKLMGLAPYGGPKHVGTILDHLVEVDANGWFRLNRAYFREGCGPECAAQDFSSLFGQPRRLPDAPMTQYHKDLASSIQAVAEEIVLRLVRMARRETGLRNLCLGGEVALNGVVNGKVLRDGAFDDIWIQPAAGEAGGALGAAFAAWHQGLARPRVIDGRDRMRGARLGPAFSQAEVEKRLTAVGARFSVLEDSVLFETCARELAAGKTLGWFQGRAEFGPRALGNRSILGDARSPVLRSDLNRKVKHREAFRPFAPSVLCEDAGDWFHLDRDSPYMLLVAEVKRPDIPAATHVDGSARVQTVSVDDNPRYHALIRAFQRRTGCPVLVNTSFNIRGEPIVGTPEEAFRCFMGTEIDGLVIENCFLKKADQDPTQAVDYRNTVEPD